MKKLLVFGLFLFVGLTSSFAQDTAKKSCAKKCTKTASSCTKSGAASTTASLEIQDQKVMKAALAAADQDESIEKRVCEKSGSVSFAKKSVCATSGKVSYSDVAFEPATGAFVNVSPKEMQANKHAVDAKKAKSCKAGEKKACCASKSKLKKAEKVEMKAEKAEMKAEKVQLKETPAKMKLKKASMDN